MESHEEYYINMYAFYKYGFQIYEKNNQLLHSVSAPNLKLPLAGFTSSSPPNSFLLTGVRAPSGLLGLVERGVEAVREPPVNTS